MSVSSDNSDPVAQIAYFTTQNDLERALSRRMNSWPGKLARIYGVCVMLLGAGSVLGIFINRHHKPDSHITVHLLNAVFFCVTGLITLAFPLLAATISKKGRFEVSLQKAGFTIQRDGTQSTIGWSSITEVDADDEYIYVQHNREALAIPKCAFPTQSHAVDFYVLATTLWGNCKFTSALVGNGASQLNVRYAVTEDTLVDPFFFLTPWRLPVIAIFRTCAIVGSTIAFAQVAAKSARPWMGLSGYLEPLVTFLILEVVFILTINGLLKLLKTMLMANLRSQIIGENMVMLTPEGVVRSVGDYRMEYQWSKVRSISENANHISFVYAETTIRRTDIPKGAFADPAQAEYFAAAARALRAGINRGIPPEFPATSETWPPPPRQSAQNSNHISSPTTPANSSHE